MKKKSNRPSFIPTVPAASLWLGLLIVFSVTAILFSGRAEAATKKKIKFASHVSSTAKASARAAGATSKSKIAIVNVVSYTNVYSKRSTSSKIKGRLYKGTGVYVIKTKGAFSYVSSGSVKGWVKKKLLLTGTKGKKLMGKMSPKVAKVTATDLNVRSDNSASSDIVVNLKKGEKVIVTGVSGDWAKVRLTDDETGYIYRKYANIKSGLATGVSLAQENAMEQRVDDQEEENESSSSRVTDSGADEKSGSSSVPSGNWKSLGTFQMTAYCPCSKCSSYGYQTATGVRATAKHTIAVDRNVIPLGSKIRIAGSDIIYVAEDTGVKGRTIDIFFENHSETIEFGRRSGEIFILED